MGSTTLHKRGDAEIAKTCFQTLSQPVLNKHLVETKVAVMDQGQDGKKMVHDAGKEAGKAGDATLVSKLRVWSR